MLQSPEPSAIQALSDSELRSAAWLNLYSTGCRCANAENSGLGFRASTTVMQSYHVRLQYNAKPVFDNGLVGLSRHRGSFKLASFV